MSRTANNLSVVSDLLCGLLEPGLWRWCVVADGEQAAAGTSGESGPVSELPAQDAKPSASKPEGGTPRLCAQSSFCCEHHTIWWSHPFRDKSVDVASCHYAPIRMAMAINRWTLNATVEHALLTCIQIFRQKGMCRLTPLHMLPFAGDAMEASKHPEPF